MSNRYRHYQSYNRGQQGGLSGFIGPFLIFVAIGVIGVLFFNLWQVLFASEVKQGAYLHILEGNAQMKTWGTETFIDLNSDTLVMEGDEILSSGDAKIIVEFFDGTIMRLDSSSGFVLEHVDEDSKNPEIEINLLQGKVWFNKVYGNTASTDLIVRADDIAVRSDYGSLFEVENEQNEVVRVFKVFEKNEGVLVDILSTDGEEKAIETEKIGVAQQIVFSKKVLEKYREFQSPTVLNGISDEFKETDWYLWNKKEDSSPTQFEKNVGADNVGLKKVKPKVLEEEEADLEESEEDEVKEEEKTEVDKETDKTEEEKDTKPTGALTKPEIVSVAGVKEKDANGFYRVTSRVATLTGNVSGADKVVVNGYTLQKFVSGDSSWSYFANADFALMKPGENTYEVYAIDAEGNKSEPLIVKVIYEPPAEVKEEKPAEPEMTESEKITETDAGTPSN